jgi:mannose/fructose/N-acetylgalactosamine-specific phosphotransferase system component IIB
MKNVVFSRIDDRLIHGQVMTGWVQYVQATEVVIIDDKVAKDEFTKMIMQSSMPKKIILSVLSTQDAVKYLLEDNKKADDKYFLLVKTPMVILELIKAGVSIKKLCIGGIGARKDRTPFYRNISASDEERECLKEISATGTDVFAQVLTDNAAVPLSQIIS